MGHSLYNITVEPGMLPVELTICAWCCNILVMFQIKSKFICHVRRIQQVTGYIEILVCWKGSVFFGFLFIVYYITTFIQLYICHLYQLTWLRSSVFVKWLDSGLCVCVLCRCGWVSGGQRWLWSHMPEHRRFLPVFLPPGLPSEGGPTLLWTWVTPIKWNVVA